MILRWFIIFVVICSYKGVAIESPILGYSPQQKRPVKQLKLLYLKYASTQDVFPMLRAICSDCQWVVSHVDQSIGLATNSKEWALYKSAIQALDRKRKQVKLEVDIVEINNIYSNRYKQLFSKLTQPLVLNQSVSKLIELMISSGNASILSSPRVMSRSGKQVLLKVGDQIPYKTINQNATSTQTNIQYIQSGVELKITPYIHYDQQIDLNIDLTYKAVTGYRIENESEMPIIATRKSQVNLQVSANSTIVFAGLLDRTNHETIEKVPFLADLPLIGELFKKKIIRKRTSDLIYKIQASIIN